MSDLSEYAGSASEAEEEPPQVQPEQAEPKRLTVPRKPKLDAERVLDNRQGVQALVDDFRRVSFQGKGHEVSDLDLLISTFEKWAQALYPYGQNILDFSRTVETELGRPQVRSRLMDYRQDYIRTIVQAPAEQPAPAPQPVETQEELMRKKEENRRLALEKLRQRQAELKVATEQQQSADVVMEMTPERQHQS